jgi:hypothetical protein
MLTILAAAHQIWPACDGLRGRPKYHWIAFNSECGRTFLRKTQKRTILIKKFLCWLNSSTILIKGRCREVIERMATQRGRLEKGKPLKCILVHIKYGAPYSSPIYNSPTDISPMRYYCCDATSCWIRQLTSEKSRSGAFLTFRN